MLCLQSPLLFSSPSLYLWLFSSCSVSPHFFRRNFSFNKCNLVCSVKEVNSVSSYFAILDWNLSHLLSSTVLQLSSLTLLCCYLYLKEDIVCGAAKELMSLPVFTERWLHLCPFILVLGSLHTFQGAFYLFVCISNSFRPVTISNNYLILPHWLLVHSFRQTTIQQICLFVSCMPQIYFWIRQRNSLLYTSVRSRRLRVNTLLTYLERFKLWPKRRDGKRFSMQMEAKRKLGNYAYIRWNRL